MRLHMQLHATNAQPAVLPFLTRDHPDLLHSCRHRYAIHVYIFVGTYTRATLTARLALLSRWTDTNDTRTRAGFPTFGLWIWERGSNGQATTGNKQGESLIAANSLSNWARPVFDANEWGSPQPRARPARAR